MKGKTLSRIQNITTLQNSLEQCLKGKELISFANLLKETIQERLARINTKRLLRFEILYIILCFRNTDIPPTASSLWHGREHVEAYNCFKSNWEENSCWKFKVFLIVFFITYRPWSASEMLTFTRTSVNFINSKFWIWMVIPAIFRLNFDQVKKNEIQHHS